MINILNRGSIIISVHADDEIYLCSSFVFNYPFPIIMHVPFLGDMSKEAHALTEQKEMLSRSLLKINEYRKANGFHPITLGHTGFGYRPNGLSDEEFRNVTKYIEDSINKFDSIDYYVRTCPSTHQNHCHAYTLSNTVLRSPYIDKINNIITSSYPTDFSVGDYGRNTAFQDMDEEQVNLACNILDEIYLPKTADRKTLSSENFRLMLKFMGSVSQNDYAQAYQVDRERMYGAKYNKILSNNQGV